MLSRLYISQVVLIDKLELEFDPAMTVLTGETGAGKSILLDALALALGAKSDTGLIRSGSPEATVIAEFSDGTMLKRTLSVDGKTKCWINDEPATLKALKELGEILVEVHGQFSSNTLLDEKTHLQSLDSFGNYKNLIGDVREMYAEFHKAEKSLRELRDLLNKSAAEKEFLEHNVRELESLNPKVGEESELASARQKMMDAEKNSGILKDAVEMLSQNNMAEKVFSAAHILERAKSYQKEVDKLYEIGSELQEISDSLKPDDFNVQDLESSEERLFALRAAARKHRVAVDELPAYLEKMRDDLAQIDNSDAELKKLESVVDKKHSAYDELSDKLTQERIATAEVLRARILDELPDLKLGATDFKVEITKKGEPSETGGDKVVFMIRTNPGHPFAPLDKIASGGELARLMLALRVVLMNNSRALIFDEIDTGISGATAAAVGQRLSRLASGQQLIVITHSAQVAGFGNKHFLIAKNSDGKMTTTNVQELSGDDRICEIARIISGAKITVDSLAAAKELLYHPAV